MQIPGDADTTIPYSNYLDTDTGGAVENIENFGGINGCKGLSTLQGVTSAGGYTQRTYANCEGSTEVALVTLHCGPHVICQERMNASTTTPSRMEFYEAIHEA
jgi:poly(3-hydroxybutyrate) depolymerase